MSKSWSKTIKYNGKTLVLGFIDDGGHGDRHYLIVEGIVAPIDLANVLVPILKTIKFGESEVGNG